VLRVLLDRPDNTAQCLILGSASRDLIRQSSETLAGRIGRIELTPLQLGEAGVWSMPRLWLRGGFPPSFLAASDSASRQRRKDSVATSLDRDLPALGIGIPPPSGSGDLAATVRPARGRASHERFGRPFRRPPGRRSAKQSGSGPASCQDKRQDLILASL